MAVTIKIKRKFTEKHLDVFADQIFKELNQSSSPSFLFDFKEVEWISNEELVVFTSTIKYLRVREISFRIDFVERGADVRTIPERVAKQVIQLWDIWRIYDILGEDVDRYMGFGRKGIELLRAKYNYYPASSEIFERHGITPFITLEKVDDYHDKIVSDILSRVYRLNQATKELLRQYKSEHPFVTNVMSHIITKELYENFLDHFETGAYKGGANFAFMSLCLKTQLKEESNSFEKIQRISRSNFQSEALPETLSFHFDDVKREYKNQTVIQFSFLDFGTGIVSTLSQDYLEHTGHGSSTKINDSDILAYAFQHTSSRHGILERTTNRKSSIPRGLFDVLSMVKMYRGMLVARSNYGKVLYNFSGAKSFDQALTIYPRTEEFFLGTLITISIPAGFIPSNHEISSIKPSINLELIKGKEVKYLNLFHIINLVKSEKKNSYENLIREIRKQLPSDGKLYTIYFSFRGYQYDIRLAKKAIYFLLSDYDINLKCNIIIVHPPDISIVEEISREVADLSSIEKTYHIHPLPLIYLHNNQNDLKLVWLGVYDPRDNEKLDVLLTEQFSLAATDFNEPGNVVGHVNYFDKFGNLRSFIPERQFILDYYKKGYNLLDEREVEKMLIKNECLIKGKEVLYLCHGNYYQREFVEIIHLLNDQRDCNLICEILFRKIQDYIIDHSELHYIAVTTSSHKIIDSLIHQELVSDDKVLRLDNYFSFDNENGFEKIREGVSYILICDIISTGFLARKLKSKVEAHGATFVGVAVMVNTMDDSFEDSKDMLMKNFNILIDLYKYPIPKYRRDNEEVRSYLKMKSPIRINPFTNLAITLHVNDTITNSILVTTDEFLKQISENSVKMGYLLFNEVIHPYFFDTKEIIRTISIDFLRFIFEKIKINSKTLNVFYPKDSGIQYFNFDILSTHVFKNHSVSYYQLERFTTSEGWRFPHATDYFINLNENKSILILDDGSCTGDSILQMIDEIAFSRVKEITLLCFIGRISDHKREFFSRVSEIKGTNGGRIKVSIYFVCHWHIPTYYVDENPNIREREWLTSIIALPNTPENIRSIAIAILKGITPQPIDKIRDYRFLPRKREKPLETPKIDILRVREEIGKVIGYRFYKESFQYFDKIIRLYEGGERKDRYREMELLCSTFLYEPYLYSKISVIMPDIVDKIEEFVDALIFGNPKKENRTLSVDKALYYKWDKKDIIHLFFIIYKGNKLYEKLNDTQQLQLLLNYLEDADNSLYYVLYKLLSYFPIQKEDLPNKNAGQFLHLVDVILQNNILPTRFSSVMKIFRSFVSTLPINHDYFSQLSSIQEYYRIMKDSAAHKESVLAQYDRLIIDLEVMKRSFKNVVFSEFQETWQIVSKFIEHILSFSRAFPTFFLTKLSIVEGDTENSLRYIHGQLNELINNLNPSSEFNKIQSLLEKIADKVINQYSILPKIFSETTTTNAVNRISNLLKERSQKTTNIKFLEVHIIPVTIDLPFYHLEGIILTEILSNFRHSVHDTVEIKFIKLPEYLEIQIANRRSTDSIKGGGHGLAMLNKLKSFPEEIIAYHYYYNEEIQVFEQTLKIKTI